MAVDIISAQKVRELLNYDPATGVFTWRITASSRAKVGDVAGTPREGGRIAIGVCGSIYLAHRLAWLHVYGTWPSKVIDHINGDQSDNRISNLRDVSNQTNSHNLQKLNRNNTSGHTGVSWNKRTGKWAAQIKLNRKIIYLGLFTTIEEAIVARESGKLKYHPSFPSSHVTHL